MRWGLVADDLTGACDAGVQFAQKGFTCIVLLQAEQTSEPSAELMVLSTESRHDPPAVAQAKAERACSMLKACRAELVFKKVDSTLRGNLGFELEAIMAAAEFSLALVAPAFPRMGRVIVEGRLRVAGVPESGTVHLPALLAEQGVQRLRWIGQPEVARGVDGLLEHLREAGRAGDRVVVLDSVCEDDLAVVARAGMALEPRPLLVGSAGLAGALAEVLPGRLRSQPGKERGFSRIKRKPGPAVLLLGSTHPVTRRQAHRLLEQRRCMVVASQLEQVEKARRAIADGFCVVAHLDVRASDLPALEAFVRGLRELPIGGFVVSGGDTLALVSRALGAVGIRLEREILPGIPVGTFWGGSAPDLPVVTKAGSFGDENALVTAADFFAAPPSALP